MAKSIIYASYSDIFLNNLILGKFWYVYTQKDEKYMQSKITKLRLEVKAFVFKIPKKLLLILKK